MKRYVIFIKFRGTAYHGWQIQDNAHSVQKEIQNALSTLLQEKIEITGAGRTDTGVHATMMAAHFDAENIGEKGDFLYHLNGLLPPDIAVFRIAETSPDFHARFDVLNRSYVYQICFQKDPFLNDYAYRLPQKPDLVKMNMAAEKLIGESDFSCFSKAHTQTKTNRCEIIHAAWKENPDVWVFEITADRFLRNMVRAIVGTLLEIGNGKRSLESLDDLILSKDRSLAGISVPGHALFLSQLSYPESSFI